MNININPETLLKTIKSRFEELQQLYSDFRSRHGYLKVEQKVMDRFKSMDVHTDLQTLKTTISDLNYNIYYIKNYDENLLKQNTTKYTLKILDQQEAMFKFKSIPNLMHYLTVIEDVPEAEANYLDYASFAPIRFGNFLIERIY